MKLSVAVSIIFVAFANFAVAASSSTKLKSTKSKSIKSKSKKSKSFKGANSLNTSTEFGVAGVDVAGPVEVVSI